MPETVEILTESPIVVEVNSAYPSQQIFIQDTEPVAYGPALWINMHAGADGKGIDIKVQTG